MDTCAMDQKEYLQQLIKDVQPTQWNLSFAGCGFLGVYHIGVAVCFKKFAPHLLLNKISGASAGAIAACCLLCDLPIGEVASDMLALIREARRRTLGPFSPSFNVQQFLMEKLNKVLPDDAHEKVSGKLHISLTRAYDGRNVILSHFNSKEDLLQALLASAFVPVFSGFIPSKYIDGTRYMDGGFSNNLPILDESTITVSPFAGECDICPRDFSSQLFHVNLANTSIELSKQNVYRFIRILWPPKPEVLASMCKQGFDDALRFLHRNNLINCTKCLSIQSTFIMSEITDENLDYDPQCQECKLHRQEALVANLPDTLITVFQEAIDAANKGLYNWMLSNRGVRLITFLTLPYTIPLEIIFLIIKRSLRLIPHMAGTFFVMTKFFIGQLMKFIYLMNVANRMSYLNSYYEDSFSDYLTDDESIAESDIDISSKLSETHSVEDVSSQTFKTNSRRSSVCHKMDLATSDDTFESILTVTSHHDAIMAFYYMDENNKVKVTEIFDVTESDDAPQQDEINIVPEDLTEASTMNSLQENDLEN